MEEHCSHRQMTSEDVPVIIGVIIKPLNKGHLGGTKCHVHRDVSNDTLMYECVSMGQNQVSLVLIWRVFLEVTQPLSLLHKVAPHQ